MNNDVRKAVESLMSFSEENGFAAKAIAPDEMQTLNKALGGILPEWFIELVTTYPLAGLGFHWDTDDSCALKWLDAEGIRSETLDAYPGIFAFERGFVCVGGDLDGAGDPYFLPTDAGDNPPIYRIRHDAQEESLADGFVCSSLSQLFGTSAISDLSWLDDLESLYGEGD